MTESLDNSGIRRSLRKTEVTELFESHAPPAVTVGGEVVLRQLSKGGEFSKTIKCLPGTITVIPFGKEEGDFTPFRERLLGKKVDGISVRCGSEELHASEVHLVSNLDVLSPGLTVGRLLDESGATSEEQDQALTAIGLEQKVHELTQNLTQGELRRLAIVSALFSRTRVLLLDQPFQDLETEWIPALSGLILSGVTSGNQIAIVMGLPKLPRIWKSSPMVVVAGMEVGSRQGDTFIVEETIGYLTKLRQLIGRGPGGEEDEGFIITYPQRIFKKRRSSSEGGLLVEAIRNPNAGTSVTEIFSAENSSSGSSSEQGWAAMRDSSGTSTEGSERFVEAGKRRKAAGRLTKVTNVHRMKKNRTYLMYLAMRDAMINWDRQPSEYLGGKRFDYQRAQYQRTVELERMLFLLVLVMLGLLIVNWVAK